MFSQCRIYFICLIILPFTLLNAGPDASPVKKKVDELLSKMTLEEKVGQMTQLTLQPFAKKEGNVDQKFEVDIDKLREGISRYHIGSIINVHNAALTIDEWQALITDIQNIATKETRLGIPVLYGIDAIHGANYTMGATLFPQSINMAATWNRDLVYQEGVITALETRASGIPWNFNPVLGLGRNPLWPRFWETYGEDTYVAATLGSIYVKGQEGENNTVGDPDKVAACMKHFLGYSLPLSGRDRTPAWIPERIMRDFLLPPFKAAVEAGVQTAMINSSEINGIPVHADPVLLTEVLRNELGFEGLIVTDWQDIERLYSRERVASSYREAVKMAINAGIDMSMVPYNYEFYGHLLDLAKSKEVAMSRIDDAVRRILTLKMNLDLFEKPFPDKTLRQSFASEEAIGTSLQAARESIILAKNEDDILPLKKGSKILVCGPNADRLSPLNGGWSYTWQGNVEALFPQEKSTVLEAIQQKTGSENVSFVQGAEYEQLLDVEAAQVAAEDADAVILCLGEASYCETPGNIDDLALPGAQLELAKKLAASGKPLILVMIEGRPRVISDIEPLAQAVILAMLPGNEGGTAIADVLFGDFNPGGKLPFTYPRTTNYLMTYDHKPSELHGGNVFNPQWAFGHGMSYTDFSYSELQINKEERATGNSFDIRVSVTNTGTTAGHEAVLLFVTDKFRSITPPVRQLKRFAKVYLQPGESKEVHFNIDDQALSFIDRDMKRIVEAGEFEVEIGGLRQGFNIVRTWQLSQE